MNHLDTNILLRLATGMPEPLLEKSLAVVEKAKAEGNGLFVASLAVAEAYFTLTGHYGLPKAEVARILHGLLSEAPFVCAPGVREALAAYRGSGAGLADRLLLAEAQADGAKLLTLDKALGKLEGAKWVG